MGVFHKWGYPKWMVSNGKSHLEMDDLGVLFPPVPFHWHFVRQGCRSVADIPNVSWSELSSLLQALRNATEQSCWKHLVNANHGNMWYWQWGMKNSGSTSQIWQKTVWEIEQQSTQLVDSMLHPVASPTFSVTFSILFLLKSTYVYIIIYIYIYILYCMNIIYTSFNEDLRYTKAHASFPFPPPRRSHRGFDAGAAVFGLCLAGRLAHSGRLVLLLCAPGDLCIARWPGVIAMDSGGSYHSPKFSPNTVAVFQVSESLQFMQTRSFQVDFEATLHSWFEALRWEANRISIKLGQAW